MIAVLFICAGNNDVEADLEKFSMQPFRKVFKGAFIEAGGFTPASAATEVAAGNTDLVAFGRWWLANPDFLQRVREGAPLNKCASHLPVLGFRVSESQNIECIPRAYTSRT